MGGIRATSLEEKKDRRRAAVKRAMDKYMKDKHRVQVTLSSAEFSTIESAAKQAGVSVTAYIREAAIDVASGLKRGRRRSKERT